MPSPRGFDPNSGRDGLLAAQKAMDRTPGETAEGEGPNPSSHHSESTGFAAIPPPRFPKEWARPAFAEFCRQEDQLPIPKEHVDTLIPSLNVDLRTKMTKLMRLTSILILTSAIGVGCGGSSDGSDGRDCQDDLNEIRADACFPTIEQLAIANGVTEESFLDTCRSTSIEEYWNTRRCIVGALQSGQCEYAFRLYWYGADSNCNLGS